MLELDLLDGKKSYVPISRVLSIQENTNGKLVIAVENGGTEPQWHNISGFVLLREGQRVQG